MISCSVKPLNKILSNEKQRKSFESLLSAQWLEVDHRRKTSEFDPDFDQYLSMQDIGMHYIAFSFDDDEIVGYMSMFCAKSPHTREVTATTDTVYINRDYRKNGLGIKMINECEKEARARKARHIMITFKNDQKHPSIVEDCGFFSYETIYSKFIGEKQ